MRSLAFVNHIKFSFDGNISKDAIVVADCDNDGDNELIAASVDGDLAVFKGMRTNAWVTANHLGMVISVIVGDILNDKKNYIITVSVEGYCNIFNLCDEEVILDIDESKSIIPFYSQRMPANTKIACLADIDNDGQNEFIVGLTDRVVRTYRCVHINDKIKLIGIHKWEFIDQIGTLSLNPCNNENETVFNILVAQPGGTYAKLECWSNNNNFNNFANNNTNDGNFDKMEDTVSKLTPEYYELSITQMRNPNISTEIIGGIKGKNRCGFETNLLIALATLDGTLMLVDGRDILWSLQVDHQLFALSKLDITGDSNEEIIVCAWNGETYIVNQSKQSLRFKFEEPVSAFITGNYTLEPNKSKVKCFVYATFDNSIYLYYDINVNQIESTDFKQVIHSDNELINDLKQLMHCLDIHNESKSNTQSICSDILFALPQI